MCAVTKNFLANHVSFLITRTRISYYFERTRARDNEESAHVPTSSIAERMKNKKATTKRTRRRGVVLLRRRRLREDFCSVALAIVSLRLLACRHRPFFVLHDDAQFPPIARGETPPVHTTSGPEGNRKVEWWRHVQRRRAVVTGKDDP